MSAISSPIYHYQPGGSLPPDAPTYVKRQADDVLYQSLLEGTYCYILNARQMGKSSLRIRTMGLLEAQGITCADIELTGIGSQQITVAQWYGGVIQELVSGFGLSFKRRSWMQEREDLPPVQRLSQFIETVLLTQISTPIVVFIDEIDSVLGLGFPSGDFFALIRHCYEKRATHEDYKRLTFVLLGVATPSDLIRNKQHSPPFNIGRAIPLQGFHIDDCAPLIQGLSHYVKAPKAVLKEILYWSGGQPFLTQKLCWLVTQYGRNLLGEREIAILHHSHSPEALSDYPLDHSPQNPQEQQVRDFITRLVKTYVIQNWEAWDEPEHLRTISDRLLRESESNPKILWFYRDILRTGSIAAKDEPEHLKLRFSGIVDVHQGQLRIKNPIYSTIFNHPWVEQAIKTLPSPPQPLSKPSPHPHPKQPRYAYPTAIAISLGIAMTVLVARFMGLLEPWELSTFDQLMRLRPPEPADERLLLVTITEADIQSQPIEDRGAASLTDESLTRLLTIVEQGNPRAIGLDIYREQQVDHRYPALAELLATNDRLFAICYYGVPGTPPPPEVPEYQHGFNTVSQDTDGVLRRQILTVSLPAPCQNEYSLNWWLAARYLYAEGIEPTRQGNDLKLGTVHFKNIQHNIGGYHQADTDGHQILINYRATTQIAETVTLEEILSADFDLHRIQDRIVLIGVVAPTFNDHNWFTPYSSGGRNPWRMAGVEIQAHMTSQLISVVLDGRPLLWSWPETVEILWIGTWTVTAGIVALQLRSRHYFILALGSMVFSLGGLCWILICYGGWIPFTPALLGIIGSGVGVNIYGTAITKQ